MRWRTFGLLCLVLLCLQASPLAAAGTARERLLQKGYAAFQRQEWPEAEEALVAAYRLQPAPQLLYAIGRVYDEERRTLQAFSVYREFVARVPRSRWSREQARYLDKVLPWLRGQLGRIQPTGQDGAWFTLDDGARQKLPVHPIWVAPGHHRLRFQLGARTVVVMAGELATVAIPAQADPASRRELDDAEEGWHREGLFGNQPPPAHKIAELDQEREAAEAAARRRRVPLLFGVKAGAVIGIGGAQAALYPTNSQFALVLDFGFAVNRDRRLYVLFPLQFQLGGACSSLGCGGPFSYNVVMVPAGLEYDIPIARVPGLYLYPRFAAGYAALLPTNLHPAEHLGLLLPEFGVKFLSKKGVAVGIEPFSLPIFVGSDPRGGYARLNYRLACHVGLQL